MSNKVTIQPTIFKDFPDGEETYGVRVFDDYASFYNNFWPKEAMDEGPKAILERAIATCTSDTAVAMFEFSKENEGGIYIGDDWHEWKD